MIDDVVVKTCLGKLAGGDESDESLGPRPAGPAKVLLKRQLPKPVGLMRHAIGRCLTGDCQCDCWLAEMSWLLEGM